MCNCLITLSHVDLNLLLGLDALLEKRSVQDAAAQLRLTPPAVSRILSRLRAATGDEILIRNGRHMVPTPRALELQDEVRELVSRAELVLAPLREFDLRHLHRTFTVRCHEALIAPVAADLVTAVAAEAPHVQVKFVAERSTDDRDLTHGQVDLDIGDVPTPQPTVRSQVIATDTMMLVTRTGSSLDRDQPDVETFAATPQVAVSRRGRSHGPIDDRLATYGLTRHVIAIVPTVPAALAILKASPCVTVLPQRVTHDLPSGLTSRRLPFPLAAAPIALSWHRRHDKDPAHMWLRAITAAALR